MVFPVAQRIQMVRSVPAIVEAVAVALSHEAVSWMTQ